MMNSYKIIQKFILKLKLFYFKVRCFYYPINRKAVLLPEKDVCLAHSKTVFV